MRSLIPVLAITLGLMVAAPALAKPADQGVATSAVAGLDLRAPDQTNRAVVTQDFRAPDRTTAVAVAPAAVSTPDGGLSTALIVLLAVGGAVMLAATAFVGRRYAQARGAHVSS
jgi:hypothetical protein